MESYEDWLVYDLKNLPSKRAELAATDNPYMREYLTRHIADMERLLSQLGEQERAVIETTVICRKNSVPDMNKKQLYVIKRNAIDELCRLRFGVAYRP